jgi:hypothetical protein
MSFHPLLEKLERIDYIGSWVEADSSRWKLGCSRWMSTCNEMDAREGYAHYRYDICNDTGHNRKSCSNWQHMYNNLLSHVMIYYDIF